MTLRAAIELDVLDIMAEAGPDARLWPEEIASKIQTNNPDAHEVLDRMLRFLAAHKVVTCEVVVGEEDGKSKRRYGLGPVCKYFTKNKGDGSVAPMVLKNQHPIFVEAWANIKHAVLDGSVPLIKAHGMTIYEHEDKDPPFQFHSERSNLLGHDQIIFSESGVATRSIEAKTSSLRILYKQTRTCGDSLSVGRLWYRDIPGRMNSDYLALLTGGRHIIANGEHGWMSGPDKYERVEFVGGDMFESVPTGDGIFMKCDKKSQTALFSRIQQSGSLVAHQNRETNEHSDL
ncbi:caffeic acid 3-O-methyltransferase-like [Dioscorea cayenensis subsp. rotundata]|uniref:Caffeic acid 3-O-methyltransferase-like n=1 Tax=Dioscorea cayennensis subsp. rotundata TaxID=55577 RepID=A0AB40CEV7_DIOCR|nr:caffeic acid 3-O-methyltransferase-like [Dioscorea cayenensis subsp. rotundata]